MRTHTDEANNSEMTMSPYEQACSTIVEREFRKAAQLPASTSIVVKFRPDETIEVTVNSTQVWTMEILGDDDEFSFHHSSLSPIRFPWPNDWPIEE